MFSYLPHRKEIGFFSQVIKLHKAVQYICDEGSAVQFLQSLTAMSRDLSVALENDKKRDREVPIQPTLHLQVFPVNFAAIFIFIAHIESFPKKIGRFSQMT